ncbi:MAG: alpha/beta fold hydrolase [Candidatus Gastranaerophilales bacterium]|nr:alpha/beta fold hydrolase [Candidatus Gastranaerophilales bacterium]
MKKFFGYVIIVLLLFSFVCSSEAEPKKKKIISSKHKIEFVTRDKFILVGDLYFANNPSDKPLVVCLHSFSMNAQVWKDLAQNLRQKGYNVLAMDLRGHGRSVYNENLKLKSRYYYKQDTWQKLPKDVYDAVKYVKANYPKINCDETIIIGADIGASAGTIGAMSLSKPPQKIILISPMLEFKGLKMPIRTNKFINTKIMMVLAKTDRILINFNTKMPPLIKHYPVGGPGNQLIKANKEAYDDIIKFIIN